jgi:quercetin dioxygenase-like cupin family protein
MKTAAPTKLRFLDGTASIVMSRHETGGVSVVDVEMPAGTTSVVHAHDEDESIRVLQGRVSFVVDGETIVGEPGETVVLPKGLPHSYEVESPGGARWLSITSPGRFEDFVRAVGRIEPDPIALTIAAADSGIELLGLAAAPVPALAHAA